MTKAQIAKNLLADKTCMNCMHNSEAWRGSLKSRESCFCNRRSVVEVLPEENTCYYWSLWEEIVFAMKTFPVKVKARKLKVKWTLMNEIIKGPNSKKPTRRKNV